MPRMPTHHLPPVDGPEDWVDEETPPDDLGAPCTECGQPTLSTFLPLCAPCEANAEGYE